MNREDYSESTRLVGAVEREGKRERETDRVC